MILLDYQMEFDIKIDDKRIKVRYGTTLKTVISDNGLKGQIINQYGKDVPLCLPLRGPSIFKTRLSTE